MVRITKFRTSGISREVPEARISPTGEGAVYRELGKIGQDVKTLADDYLKQKRMVEAENYKSTKLTEIKMKESKMMEKWTSTSPEGIVNLRDDGYMNPDVYGKRDDGSLKTLADVRADFWDNEIESGLDDAPTSDASNLFEVAAVKGRNTSVLSGETRSQAMFAANEDKMIQDRIALFQTNLLTLPKTDAALSPELKKQIMEGYSNTSDFIVSKVRSGTISTARAKEHLKKLKSTTAQAYVENLRKNSDWSEIIRFINVGADRGLREEEQKKLFSRMFKEIDEADLSAEEKAQFKEDLIEANDSALGDDPLEEISTNAFTPEQIIAYTDEAFRKLLDNKFLDARTIRNEMNSLIQGMRTGNFDAQGKDRAMAESILNKLKANKSIPTADKIKFASQYRDYQNLYKARESIYRTPPNMRAETAKNFKEFIAQGPAELKELFPGEAQSEFIKNSAFIKTVNQDAVNLVDKMVVQAGKDSQEQSAKYFTNPQLFPEEAALYAEILDPSVGEAIKKVARDKYVARMEQKFNDFGILPNRRKLVRDEDIANFDSLFGAEGLRTQDKVNALIMERGKWGEHWSKVVGEYVSRGKNTPPEIKVASFMTDERAMFDFIQLHSPETKEAIDSNFKAKQLDVADIRTEINDNDDLEDFFQSLRASYQFEGQGEEMVNIYRSAIELQAKQRMLKDMDSDDAVEESIEYMFEKSLRMVSGGNSSKVYIPSSQVIQNNLVESFLDSSDSAEEFSRFNIRPPAEAARIIPERELILEDLEKGQDVNQVINDTWNEYLSANGRWVNNPDGSGLYLVVMDQSGRLVPVRRNDDQPVSFTWEQIREDAQALEGTRSLVGGQ